MATAARKRALVEFRRRNVIDPVNGLTDELIDQAIADYRKEHSMAAKTKTEFPADIQEKIDAYAALHGVTAEQVVELALRDWFSDVDRGKRPRSSSILEPAL
mgnify:CR=1 FL=1